jgi:maleamate amidohydrolase
MTDFSTDKSGMMVLGPRPIVLALDLMHFYYDADSPMRLPNTASLESAARVIEAARSAVLPVVHARTMFGARGSDSGLSLYKVPALQLLIGDNDMNELMPQVTPLDDELVLSKQSDSAFFATSLATSIALSCRMPCRMSQRTCTNRISSTSPRSIRTSSARTPPSAT